MRRNVITSARISSSILRRNYSTDPLPMFKHSLFIELDKQLHYETVNPTTAKVIKEFETDSLAAIHKKFIRSYNGQKVWARVPLDQRCKILRRFGELLIIEKDQLAATLAMEMGKPITQGRAEVEATNKRVQFFVDNITEAMSEKIVRTTENGNMVEKVSWEAQGPVLNISAWNYPFFVGSNVWVPALLAGNSVVYKPSELIPLTSNNITRLMHQAGVPQDAFIEVLGKGAQAEALLQMPFAHMCFTGSYKTGKKVAEYAGKSMAKFTLELGGKDPVYIRPDVDIEKTAQSIAEGTFYNTGQSCCAVERIYVHKDIAGKFQEAFLSVVKNFSTTYDPMKDDCFIGPMAKGIYQLEYLEHLIMHAQRRGARLLTGGKRVPNVPGYFFEPTVLGNVNHDMEVQNFETFGPLVGLQTVGSDEEAIVMMNDTDYGLTASVFTQDERKANEILSQLDVGTCYWNACDRVSPFLPWTGHKRSGIGSTLGHEGIRAFLRPRAWHMRRPSST